MKKLITLLCLVMISQLIVAQDSVANLLKGKTGADVLTPYSIYIGELLMKQEQLEGYNIPESILKKNFNLNGYSYKKYTNQKLKIINLRHCSFMFEINGVLCKSLKDERYFNVDLSEVQYIESFNYIPKSEYKEKLPIFKDGVLSVILDSNYLDSFRIDYVSASDINL